MVGSGRMPAATRCFRLQQTFGRVAVYPYSQNGTLFNVTPLTRSVGDAALLLDVMPVPIRATERAAGIERQLERGYPMTALRSSRRLQSRPWLRGCRSGDFASCADAVKVFSDLGCIVDQVDPGIEDPFPIFRTFWARAAKLLALSGLAAN